MLRLLISTFKHLKLNRKETLKICSDYLKGENENFEEFDFVELTRYKITFTLIFADLNIYEN